MFVSTALLTLLSFTNILTLLHYFLFGMAQLRRINTSLCVWGRTAERPGDRHMAPITPNADDSGGEGSEHHWRRLPQQRRALAGAPQFTASLPPSLVSNTRTLHSWTVHAAGFFTMLQEVSVRSNQSLPVSPSAALWPTVHVTVSHAKTWPQLFGQPVRGSFQCICIFLVVITMVSH